MPEVPPKLTSSENCVNDQLATFPFRRNPTTISKAAATKPLARCCKCTNYFKMHLVTLFFC